MTREEAISLIKSAQLMLINPTTNEPVSDLYAALDMAIQALSQEPCQLLIIKSDIFLHQDDRKKWMDSIKREKENGVIILPPYFTPLLVPDDVEIRIEQSCDDAISREYLFKVLDDFCGHDRTETITLDTLADLVYDMPTVTQKSGKWINDKNDIPICSRCGYIPQFDRAIDDYEYSNYCPSCGAKMVEPRESEEISERNMKMWEEIFKAESEGKK